jgi:hypothetical protein
MMPHRGPTRRQLRAPRTALACAAAGFLALLAASAIPGRAEDLQPANAVDALQKKLDAGEIQLGYAGDGHGYLPAVLKAFNVPGDSQLLVFSGSSMQFDHINQKTPRAIYYQDDVAVGAVQAASSKSSPPTRRTAWRSTRWIPQRPTSPALCAAPPNAWAATASPAAGRRA